MKNDITVKQWAAGQIDGLNISNTQYARFEFPRHFHNYYTILIIEEGVNQGFTDKHQYQIGPGTILIINPGEVHAGKSKAGNLLKFSSLLVEVAFLKKMLTENGIAISEDVVLHNKPINHPILTQKLHALLNAVAAGSPQMLTKILALDFFMEMFDNCNVNNKRIESKHPGLPYLEKARCFIKNNYHRNITLSDIAMSGYVSEYHLIRQFQRYFGLTPFEYLRNYRVEKARQLLQQEESISQVALTVGFYDHSHFLKNFKKLTGMKPSQYQKSAQA